LLKYRKNRFGIFLLGRVKGGNPSVASEKIKLYGNFAARGAAAV
jgi:hypothetical protein